MAPPSPLPTDSEEEQEGTDCEESNHSGHGNPDAHMSQQSAPEDMQEDWQPVKKHKGRRPPKQGIATQGPTDIRMLTNQGQQEELSGEDCIDPPFPTTLGSSFFKLVRLFGASSQPWATEF